MDKGLLIVISGPSGAGKGTVVNKLIEEGNFSLSVSATTRAPREGEVNGKSYFFKTQDEFKELINENKLLEYANFCDNYYGTPKDYVASKMAEGKSVILEIEVQGALQVKENMTDAILIFMIPPTLKELRNRLETRGTEAQDVVEKRLNRAMEEIELINKYDYIVVNDTVEGAVNQINSIVSSEKSRVKNNIEKINYFKGVK